MNFKEILNNFYHFLINLRVVKLSWIGVIITWLGSIIIGLLIGQLDPAGPSFDPAGFNPLINYISDLGNQDLTPMPIIINYGMMNSALLFIPPAFYMRKILKGNNASSLRRVLANLTLIFMLIASAGLFFTGIISEDVGDVWDLLFPIGYPWHDLVADFAFIFFMASGILVSSQFIIFPDILEKRIGIDDSKTVRILFVINTWILTPIFFGFFYTVPYLWYTDNFWTFLPPWQWAPLWEWLLMASLSAWLVSAGYLIIKQINHEL